jgi:hypothetical protein
VEAVSKPTTAGTSSRLAGYRRDGNQAVNAPVARNTGWLSVGEASLGHEGGGRAFRCGDDLGPSDSMWLLCRRLNNRWPPSPQFAKRRIFAHQEAERFRCAFNHRSAEDRLRSAR